MIPDGRIGVAVARACRDGAGWREDALLVDGVGLVERVADWLFFGRLGGGLRSLIRQSNTSPHLAALIKVVRHALQRPIGAHENVVAVDVLADQLVVCRTDYGATFGSLHKPILDRPGHAQLHAALFCLGQHAELLVVTVNRPGLVADIALADGNQRHDAALGVLVGLVGVEAQRMGLDAVLLAHVLPLHQLGGFCLGQLGGVGWRFGRLLLGSRLWRRLGGWLCHQAAVNRCPLQVLEAQKHHCAPHASHLAGLNGGRAIKQGLSVLLAHAHVFQAQSDAALVRAIHVRAPGLSTDCGLGLSVGAGNLLAGVGECAGGRCRRYFWLGRISLPIGSLAQLPSRVSVDEIALRVFVERDIVVDRVAALEVNVVLFERDLRDAVALELRKLALKRFHVDADRELCGRRFGRQRAVFNKGLPAGLGAFWRLHILQLDPNSLGVVARRLKVAFLDHVGDGAHQTATAAPHAVRFFRPDAILSAILEAWRCRNLALELQQASHRVAHLEGAVARHIEGDVAGLRVLSQPAAAREHAHGILLANALDGGVVVGQVGGLLQRLVDLAQQPGTHFGRLRVLVACGLLHSSLDDGLGHGLGWLAGVFVGGLGGIQLGHALADL